MDAPRYTSDLVIAELERAGRTLLALPDVGCRPGGYRRTASEFIGPADIWAADGRMSSPLPDPAAVSHMDRTLLLWPGLVPAHMSAHRKAVLRRALVDPETGRHLWPWRRLGQALGVSHETCRAWHGQGIARIVVALNSRNVVTLNRGAGRSLAPKGTNHDARCG